MGFRILNLPLVPFREILKMLEFSEIISISFCSQRCHNVTKRNLYKLKDWGICCVMGPTPRIILQKGREKRDILEVFQDDSLKIPRWRTKVELITFTRTLFRVSMKTSRYLTSFWLDIQFGMFECAKYVTELFQKGLHMIHFGNESMWMMNIIEIITQPSVTKTYFHNVDHSHLNKIALLHVLETCSSDNLEILGWVDKGLRRFIRFGSFRTIDVFCGEWITVKHVTKMKCSHASITYSKWTYADINKFLRNWIYRGGMPNLRWFNIGIRVDRIREEAMLDGLEEFVKRTETKRKFLNSNAWYKFDGEKTEKDYQFNDGLEIHSRTGLVASIHIDSDTKQFRMAVWH
ncbi:hypothetical protein CAEBREN_06902 [Caenorhabditis brenneri]|uniref:F-box domain-containing protein n=1 Tax=Caenorhabditis brenneri TaxID=135651 RepID=G0NLU0_CAEBE|nr:hypothetical protein CAEBREN_06902 [Caenorhabditis brenneri]